MESLATLIQGPYYRPLVFILALDLVMIILIRLFQRSRSLTTRGGALPVDLALFLGTAAIAGHALAVWYQTQQAVDSFAVGCVVAAATLGGSIVLAVTLHMIITAIVSVSVDSLYLSGHGAASVPGTYTKARSLYRAGRIDEALEAYRAYFLGNTQNPNPLFAAAEMLNATGRHEDGAEMLREIMSRFKHDIPVWCDAAYRLANHLELVERDERAACGLFRKIIQKMPRSDLGRLAGARLMERHAIAKVG